MPRIRHLKVEAVASVDRPANQKPFVLIKRVDGDEEGNMPGKQKKNAKKDDALAFDVREHVDVQKALGLEEAPDAETADAFAKQVDEAVAKAVESATKAAAEKARKEAQQQADGDGDGDGVNKAELPEPVRKRLEAQDEQIRKMQEREQRAVMLAKAQTLPVLGGELQDRAELLKGLHAGEAEAIAKLEERLQTLQKEREQSELFRASGHAGDGEADPVHAAAKRLQKAEGALTYEQAYAKALEDDPSLYERTLSS